VTLAAGVAAAVAVQSVCGLPVELKWPNDLVIGRPWRKLGGVLCEAAGQHARIDAVVVGIGINGANPASVRLDGEEGKPWRWIGPIPFTADRLDLALAALSPNFHRPGDERRSFPVAIDVAFVSSDPKATPPERLPEEPAPYVLVLDEPGR